MPEDEVGVVMKFFAKPVVAGIELTAPIMVGDTLHIRGHTTDIKMVVQSMQVENKTVQEGKPGDMIGIRVPDRAREGDKVFKVTV